MAHSLLKLKPEKKHINERPTSLFSAVGLEQMS
jgi:hypothetical protein